MPEKKDLTNYAIRFRGVFNLKLLVNGIRDWLEKSNFDITEPGYKHKAGDEGALVEIKIFAERHDTVHVKYEAEAKIFIEDMVDVEVVKNGEKARMQQGSVTVKVNCALILDYEEKFEEGKFLKTIRHFYHNIIIKSEIKNKWANPMRKKFIKLRHQIYELLEFEARP